MGQSLQREDSEINASPSIQMLNRRSSILNENGSSFGISAFYKYVLTHFLSQDSPPQQEVVFFCSPGIARYIATPSSFLPPASIYRTSFQDLVPYEIVACIPKVELHDRRFYRSHPLSCPPLFFNQPPSHHYASFHNSLTLMNGVATTSYLHITSPT